MRRQPEKSADYVKVVGPVAYVELTKGRVAVIDASDAATISGYLWCFVGGYAKRFAPGKRLESLHRFLLKPADGFLVDHENRDPLDCRRSNLRLCSATQNSRNRRPHATYGGKPVLCRFKGVTFQAGKYRAVIRVAGTTRNLGRFVSPVAAAIAYDRAARELHGEFASVNFGVKL